MDLVNTVAPAADIRELKGRLLAIDMLLANRIEPLASQIKAWHESFKTALIPSVNLAQCEHGFLMRLQGILVDAILHRPLEEDCLLGSDGHTYGKKALTLYISGFDHQFAVYHAPNFALDHTLNVASHPFVPSLVVWLKEKNCFITDTALNDAYGRLQGLGPLPLLPTRQNQLVQRLMQQRIAREVKAALLLKGAEFQHLLNTTPLDDALTVHLRNWNLLFQEAISTAQDVPATRKAMVEMLQEYLLDPIFLGAPIEDPLLGSDGVTYSEKGLALYMSRMQEPYAHRAPSFPEDDSLFTVAPHPIAKAMIDWLQETGEFHPSELVNGIYQVMVTQGRLPLIPTEANLNIARLQRDMAAMQQHIHREADLFAAAQAQNLFRLVDQAFDDLKAEMHNGIADVDGRLADLNMNDQERLAYLNAAIDHFEAEANVFLTQASNLDARARTLDANLHTADRNLHHLNASIAAARAAQKKQQGGWFKDALCMVACMVISYYMPYIAEGLVGTPIKGGGLIGKAWVF